MHASCMLQYQNTEDTSLSIGIIQALQHFCITNMGATNAAYLLADFAATDQQQKY